MKREAERENKNKGQSGSLGELSGWLSYTRGWGKGRKDDG